MEESNIFEQNVNDGTRITTAFTVGQVNISKSTKVLLAGKEF